jgi:hypothetical protein
MILRMESSLMRTLKTKERPCFSTTGNGNENVIGQMQKSGAGRTRVMLLEAVVVIREAQEGLLGMRPQIMHPGLSTSRKRILVVAIFHPLRGHHCREI